MAAVIDTEAMCVRDAARETRFALDILDNTATFDPDGTRCEVRLLSWSEKCALARYASGGGAFIECQLLAACAPSGKHRDRAALLALIMWLHAPDGAPLPLDAIFLARVTRSMCTLLGMTPTEIGALPAPEVETLWLASDEPVQGHQSAEISTFQAPTSADVTRIVIEPDPPASDSTPAGEVQDARADSDKPDPLPEHQPSDAAVPEDAIAIESKPSLGDAEGSDSAPTKSTRRAINATQSANRGANRRDLSESTSGLVNAMSPAKVARKKNVGFRVLDAEPAHANRAEIDEQRGPSASARHAPTYELGDAADGAIVEHRKIPQTTRATDLSSQASHSDAASSPRNEEAPPSQPIPIAVQSSPPDSKRPSNTAGERQSLSPQASYGNPRTTLPTTYPAVTDPRLDGLLAFVSRSARGPELEPSKQDPRKIEKFGTELAQELVDAAASLGIEQVS